VDQQQSVTRAVDHDEHLTMWIERLRDGDPEAEEAIFRHYFEPLVQFARKRLKGLPSHARDGEDVALSVLDTFMRRINDGQYTWVADREDLWRALYDVAAKRVLKEFRRQLAQKRGGGKVRTESIFDAPEGTGSGVGGIASNVDRRQQFADQLAETCSELFAQLRRQPKGEELVAVAQYRLANYTVQEVADKLDISKATVERRLDLARSVCKKVLPT